ncbi:MAG: shikimate kinase [Deltaproteobacteria bacterium HGW-Deltaproteobacteria-13]|jgi:shikimate kinase|nr:MAG: shikimate kinase [Deltaproteobacteria bacterium HGW-Deltaproteobacteria-13]
MKVVLIGYRATGKSTVGRILSAKLNINFWDTDVMVEKMMAMPVKEIVAKNGWDFFRARETEAVKFLTQKGDCVIATGGGVILSSENVDLLKQAGVIIWINAPLHDIIERLRKDALNESIRPQFTSGDLVQETTDIMKLRLPLYDKAADYIVDTTDKNADQVAAEIYQYLLKSGNLDKNNIN